MQAITHEWDKKCKLLSTNQSIQTHWHSHFKIAEHDILLMFFKKMVSREVTHFWFTGWPDHGVPSSCLSVMEFLVCIRKHMSDMPGPTVVHCRYIQ